MIQRIPLLVFFIVIGWHSFAQKGRNVLNFNKGWRFYYADTLDKSDQYANPSFNFSNWRSLNLPHDWSIEMQFDKNNPSTPEGGALPGGIGWYCKSFQVPMSAKQKNVSIEFDGVYRCSSVWLNGHLLGFRPNGYISFQYDLTPYLNYGSSLNTLVVKVDNAQQSNSRWYSGSGIYRNVRLVTTAQVAVDHWGTFVYASKVSAQSAILNVKTTIRKTKSYHLPVSVVTVLMDNKGAVVAEKKLSGIRLNDSLTQTSTSLNVSNPVLWGIENPYTYKLVSKVYSSTGTLMDEYVTRTGIRYFNFDAKKGFSLNGVSTKILGVCNHHDLGSLGAAINKSALRRQLNLLKSFGCNAIRTSHNPPAPELLDLCDEMGFIIMDEAFDMWAEKKTKYDYHIFWNEWHQRDLEDMVLRDRNHPCVFMWSVGNEIPEQHKKEGIEIATELCNIVKNLDTTRILVTGNDYPNPKNNIIKSNQFDLIGYNYHHEMYKDFPDSFPGKKFIASETTSGLQTRGEYFFPSDSIRVWPYNKVNGQRVNAKMNDDFTVSAYDNTRAPWSSTHEATWKEIKKYDFLSGLFVWTGFDYMGEPTPYSWPAKSSYFGIIDMAGFPKDVYYMYQSEWTRKKVLHVFPHWNWNEGDSVDVWAYYNQADQVELFVNGISAGIKKKQGDDLHVMWRVAYHAGNIKVVSKKNNEVVLSKQINTAGKATKILLSADKNSLMANGEDLAFISVSVVDKDGNIVPKADNKIKFNIQGPAFIAGLDNGNPVSHESFKGSERKAFNGHALAIVQSKETASDAIITASSEGLESVSLKVKIK